MKILIFLAFVASCGTADLIRDPKDVPKFAPAGYVPMGVVSYLNQGADMVINQRREDAFEKMHKSCNGEYEILKEGATMPQVSSINPNGFGGYNVSTGSQYIYIQFECTNKTAKK